MKIPIHLSKEYFYLRSLNCQWAAFLKKQSKPITEEERHKMMEYIEEKVNLKVSPEYDPELWGGYIIVPYKIEFWQGKEFRIHDRQVFNLKGGREYLEKLLINVDKKDYSTFLDYNQLEWNLSMLDS